MTLLPGEIDVLLRLADLQDDVVKRAIGRAAYLIGQSDTDTAVAYKLLQAVELGRSGRTAGELLLGFIDRGPLRWADAGSKFVESTLAQLVDCDSIDDYSLMAAISELSVVDPIGVTNMLLDRVERQTIRRGFEYRALPHHWDPPLRVRETDDFGRSIRNLREWMTRSIIEDNGAYLLDDGAALFSLLVGGWSLQALVALGDVGDANSAAELVTASRILAHAPLDILLSSASLVTDILRRAQAFGSDEAQGVFRALMPTSYGVFTVWSDQPAPEEVARLDRARALAERFSQGSIERRFYNALADTIEWRLSYGRERSSRDDGRDW
jgi:hypothetical protein